VRLGVCVELRCVTLNIITMSDDKYDEYTFDDKMNMNSRGSGKARSKVEAEQNKHDKDHTRNIVNNMKQNEKNNTDKRTHTGPRTN